DRELLADQRLQVRPLGRHLGGDLDLRIEMADALLGLVAHPPAVVTHILGQALRTLVGAREDKRGARGHIRRLRRIVVSIRLTSSRSSHNTFVSATGNHPCFSQISSSVSVSASE